MPLQPMMAWLSDVSETLQSESYAPDLQSESYAPDHLTRRVALQPSDQLQSFVNNSKANRRSSTSGGLATFAHGRGRLTLRERQSPGCLQLRAAVGGPLAFLAASAQQAAQVPSESGRIGALGLRAC